MPDRLREHCACSVPAPDGAGTCSSYGGDLRGRRQPGRVGGTGGRIARRPIGEQDKRPIGEQDNLSDMERSPRCTTECFRASLSAALAVDQQRSSS